MSLNRLASLALLAVLVPSMASAADGKLSLELNALQKSDKGCRISFLATNGLAAPLSKATFEIALFGADGAIDRLVSLDFANLSVGKTKVLQFDLAGLDCTSVSRVLVNDVTACEGEGIEAGACLAGLETSTRSKIEFGV